MNTLKRILIVDDEPNIRLVFRTTLASTEYLLSSAEDGETALRWLGEESFDLVLLDLLMPGIGGMEVLQRLRDAGNHVPVVIVTAHGSIPDAVAAMKLGAIDFLTKPISPQALREVVAEVLERHDEERQDEPTPTLARPARTTTITACLPMIDLSPAKRALNHREFDRAAELLEQALDLDPHSAEAHTLMGVLHECRGQDHAAYQSYKSALKSDPHFGPANDNMRRYCEKFGLDFHNKAINPAAS